MLAPSELILNADGSVYHLHLHPEHLAHTVIVVGDPERVPLVSQYFDSITYRIQKREFVTHTGRIGELPLSVISSGIGTDNVDILMNELDALVNINLADRIPRSSHTALRLIRIGTSGSLQADIAVDSWLLSTHGIGLDTLGTYYDFQMRPSEEAAATTVRCALGLDFQPYCVGADDALLALFRGDAFREGITLTCPGFYAPQGRQLRLSPRIAALPYTTAKTPLALGCITNLEMETAAYYAFGRALGHQCLSVNAILANRATGEFSQQAHTTVDRLIKAVLERLAHGLPSTKWRVDE